MAWFVRVLIALVVLTVGLVAVGRGLDVGRGLEGREMERRRD
jgi:hypothetical protein